MPTHRPQRQVASARPTAASAGILCPAIDDRILWILTLLPITLALMLIALGLSGCDSDSPTAPGQSTLTEFTLLEGADDWTTTSVSWMERGAGQSRFVFTSIDRFGTLHLFRALYNPCRRVRTARVGYEKG